MHPVVVIMRIFSLKLAQAGDYGGSRLHRIHTIRREQCCALLCIAFIREPL
jgi:hypothetical protein